MTDTSGSDDRTCTEYEVQEVEKVNRTGKQPIVSTLAMSCELVLQLPIKA